MIMSTTSMDGCSDDHWKMPRFREISVVAHSLLSIVVGGGERQPPCPRSCWRFEKRKDGGGTVLAGAQTDKLKSKPKQVVLSLEGSK